MSLYTYGFKIGKPSLLCISVLFCYFQNSVSFEINTIKDTNL